MYVIKLVNVMYLHLSYSATVSCTTKDSDTSQTRTWLENQLDSCMAIMVAHSFHPHRSKLHSEWASKRAIEDYLGKVMAHMVHTKGSYAAFKQLVINGGLSHGPRWKENPPRYFEGDSGPQFWAKVKANSKRYLKLMIPCKALKTFDIGSFYHLPFYKDSSFLPDDYYTILNRPINSGHDDGYNTKPDLHSS